MRKPNPDWENWGPGGSGPPSAHPCTRHSPARPSSPSRGWWSSCLRSASWSHAPSAAGTHGATGEKLAPSAQSPRWSTHFPAHPAARSETRSNASTRRRRTRRPPRTSGWSRSPSAPRSQWPRHSRCWLSAWPGSGRKPVFSSLFWTDASRSASETLSARGSWLQSSQTYSLRSWSPWSCRRTDKCGYKKPGATSPCRPAQRRGTGAPQAGLSPPRPGRSPGRSRPRSGSRPLPTAGSTPWRAKLPRWRTDVGIADGSAWHWRGHSWELPATLEQVGDGRQTERQTDTKEPKKLSRTLQPISLSRKLKFLGVFSSGHAAPPLERPSHVALPQDHIECVFFFGGGGLTILSPLSSIISSRVHFFFIWSSAKI